MSDDNPDIKPFRIRALYQVEETVTVLAKSHEDARAAYRASIRHEPDPDPEEWVVYSEDEGKDVNTRFMVQNGERVVTVKYSHVSGLKEN